MKVKALLGPPPAETLPTSMLRRLLGRKTAAVDRCPTSVASAPGTQRISASQARGPQHGGERQQLLLSRRGGIFLELMTGGSDGANECGGEATSDGGGLQAGCSGVRLGLKP
jgi:hypothetical protein